MPVAAGPGETAVAGCLLTSASSSATGFNSHAEAQVWPNPRDTDGGFGATSASASASGVGLVSANAQGGEASAGCVIRAIVINPPFFTLTTLSGPPTSESLGVGCIVDDAMVDADYLGEVHVDLLSGTLWFNGTRTDASGTSPFHAPFVAGSGLILTSTTASSTPPLVLVPGGLIAWYSFDDNAAGTYGDFCAAILEAV